VNCIKAVHRHFAKLVPPHELKEIVTDLMLKTVANGNRDVTEYLFACGADLNAVNEQGNRRRRRTARDGAEAPATPGDSPVMIAYRHGHRDLLHFLLNRSCEDAAGVSARRPSIGTPDLILSRALQSAAQKQHHHLGDSDAAPPAAGN
jgi:ankyrin repeat protein